MLLIGGTGAMGAPIVRRLLADTEQRWIPRILTRDPDSPQARTLRALDERIEIVPGDVTRAQSVARAMDQVSGVFCNTDYWSLWSESGESLETSIGVELLEMARHAMVDHFIYSSAENTCKLSEGRIQVPHFDAKADVESHILDRRLNGDTWYLDHTSILRTAPYMENFQTYFLPQRSGSGEGNLTFSLPISDKPWCMVALEDIGWFAEHLLANSGYWKGKDLAVASDVLTLTEIATAFSEVTGIPADVYVPSDDEFLALGFEGADDLLNMFRFVREVGIERDIDQLRTIHPGLLDFRAWLRMTGWRGEPRQVQKILTQ